MTTALLLLAFLALWLGPAAVLFFYHRSLARLQAIAMKERADYEKRAASQLFGDGNAAA